MFVKFWDKLSEGLGQKWATQKMGFALAFWIGGFLAWSTRHGWGELKAGLIKLDSTPIYIVLAVGGLMLVAASAAVVEWLHLPAIRLAEGYWPGPFRKLRFKLSKRVKNRLEEKDNRWSELEPWVESGEASPEQRDEYARLDAELARYPKDSARLMPTTLGNLLSAAEEYPDVRYGLSVPVCWPRLWLILPPETREALADTRERLNAGARMMVWGLLFQPWTVWAWWAPIPALALAVTGYLRMIGAAGPYGDLIRAAFDLNRFALYEALRWPLPENLKDEVDCGKELNEYLFRGSSEGTPYTG